MTKREQQEIKLFKRITMSLTDISFTGQLIDEALNFSHNELTRKAIEEAIIISYSRPFSHNDSKTLNSSGDLRQAFKSKFDDKQKKVHDRVITNLRNRVVAHSDSSSYGVSFSIFELGNDKMVLPRQRRIIELLSNDDLEILKDNCLIIISWLFDEQIRIKNFLPSGSYY